jgi:acyl carrier protein
VSEPATDHGRSERTEAVRNAVLAVAASERLPLLEAHVLEQISQVMRLPRDRINPRADFQALGMDSLMALELRNKLELSLGLTLPATLVWGHPHAVALAAHLAELLQPGGVVATSSAPPASPANGSALERVSELSDDEVERLLAEKLARKRRPA